MAQHNQDEIDLGYLFRRISGFFKSLVRLLFMVISFFIKYIIVIVILIIVGVGIGYYLDSSETKVYKNELIVIPNFESTQYFYDKVDALLAKIKDGDSVFMSKTIGPHYKALRKVEAKPIVDIFTFASMSRERVDLFKALTDKQNIPDYIKDPQNFQYFKYQHLTVNIKGKENSEEIINNLVKYLNDSAHFREYMEVGRSNTLFRIATSEKMISQIDTILKATAQVEEMKRTTPSVLVNDNSQLNDLFESKERLLYNLLRLNMQKVDEQNIIKVASINYNVLDTTGINISNKVKIPLLLILLFSGFFFMIHLYKKMKLIAENEAN